MSAPISEVVSVSITAEANGITRSGFGTALIAGFHTAYLDRVRKYSDLTELVADGIPATHPIYRAASVLLGQSPRPENFKVGRRALPFTQKINVIPTDTTQGYVYTINFVKSDGVAAVATYTVGAAATVATIIAALKTAIDALAIGATTLNNTTSLDITASTAGVLLDFSTSSALTVSVTHADPGIATDLAAIQTADNDWYGLVLDDNSKATVVAAAAWVQANQKVMAYDTIDSAVGTSATTDVMSVLKAASYSRSVGVFASNLLSYAGAAVFGKDFPTDAGSATLAFKTLAGVTVPNLTTTQRGFIEAKNGNHLSTIAGVNVLRYGKVASGEYFDIVRGIDALTAAMQENLFAMMLNNPKLPFSNTSGDVIRGTMLGTLKPFQDSNFLLNDPAPIVTVPLVATLLALDKANRVWKGIKFSATLAGAAHMLQIQGKVVL